MFAFVAAMGSTKWIDACPRCEKNEILYAKYFFSKIYSPLI